MQGLIALEQGLAVLSGEKPATPRPMGDLNHEIRLQGLVHSCQAAGRRDIARGYGSRHGR
jgi:hypothetical protein